MLDDNRYTFAITLETDPEAAEQAVRSALEDEGFGILSEIDVAGKLQEKLGVDIGHYRILGACNPPLAHQALDADPSVGALLPCNVVVRASGASTIVEAADPRAMLGIAGEPQLKDLAEEARERIRRALETVASG